MNILQTFYNNSPVESLINVATGFHSPEVHWLSVAYSCLQLRKYHPDQSLILYGNESVIDLFINHFQLPYTDYVELKETCGVKSKLYAWPKIETYSKQTEPFIHIDNDVFIWEPLPERLFSANLIAQHKELDSGFYMRIFRHIQEHNIKLPDFVDDCIDSTHVQAYNAGLFGGQDLDFFSKYLKEIKRFISDNEDQINTMPEHFLMNVVYEQWIFAGMVKKLHLEVETYYKDVVVDFKMPVSETMAAIQSPYSKYLHLMNHKRNKACNLMIQRNMYKEYPDYYKIIMEVCAIHKPGDYLGMPFSFESTIKTQAEEQSEMYFPRSLSFARENIANYEADGNLDYKHILQNIPNDKKNTFDSIYTIELEEKELFKQAEKETDEVKEQWHSQYEILSELNGDENIIEKYNFCISPYAKYIEIPEEIRNYIINVKSINFEVGVSLILSYNPFLNKIDEFVYYGLDNILISLLTAPVDIQELIEDFKKYKNFSIEKKLFQFLKIGLFNNILYGIAK